MARMQNVLLTLAPLLAVVFSQAPNERLRKLNHDIELLKKDVAAACPQDAVAVNFPKWIGKRSSDAMILLKLDIELAEKGKEHLQILLANCSKQTTPPPTTSTSWSIPFNGSLTFNDTGFEIQRIVESRIIGNSSLVFLKVKLPSHGSSVSDNWCTDYRNMCAHLGRQPVGCHVGFNYIRGVKACIPYNVDSFIPELSCSTNWAIARFATTVFPQENGVTRHNAMGFYECSHENGSSSCDKQLKKSSQALPGIQHSAGIVYTICS